MDFFMGGNELSRKDIFLITEPQQRFSFYGLMMWRQGPKNYSAMDCH
jgi:hypothetical protein